MQALARKTKTRKPAISGITGIRVSGFKSIDKEQSIEIRPLTILAGANSSGKSSMMQPLLMLKQTLEAPFDPGPLLLDGEHVRFSRTTDFLSRTRSSESARRFSVAIQHNVVMETEVVFRGRDDKRLDVERTTLSVDGDVRTVRRGMSHKEIQNEMALLEDSAIYDWIHQFQSTKIRSGGWPESSPEWQVIRNRSFLEIELVGPEDAPSMKLVAPATMPAHEASEHILRMIHLPGLRGRPERAYPKTAVGDRYPGSFGNYVASIVSEWQEMGDPRPGELARALEQLGLTSEISADYVDDTRITLEVGRLPRRSKRGGRDVVNIADAGIGVSQVVPVLVALLFAETDQLVYIEQPEIHLHPRAQTALAEIIAEAAKRGVIVVIETHSPLLILALQSLVAEGKLDPKLAKLHWFRRIRGGSTRVSSANLDDAGAFGDWPEDFADVTLDLQQRYIDAAFNRMPR